MQTVQQNTHSSSYRYVIVAVSFVLLLAGMFPVGIFGVFFEPLMTELHWSRALISGAASVNNIVFGIVCILLARLCDRFSARLVIGASGVVLGAGYALMAATDSVWLLYLSFGVVIGAGMGSFIAALNLVARWFTKRRGLMTGIAFTGAQVAAMVGPPAANWLSIMYGWRPALLILGVISLAVILVAAFFVRRDPDTTKQAAHGEPQSPLSLAGTAGLSMRQAWRSGQFWITCLAYFTGLFCSFVFIVHIVVYALGLGIAADEASNIMGTRGLVGIIVSMFLGFFGDRIGSKRTIVICFGLMAISFAYLLVAREAWQLFAFTAVSGIGICGVMVLMSSLVADVFGLKAHAIILAVSALAGTIGGAAGPLLAGYVFDLTASYTWAFIACAVLAAVTGLLMLLMKAGPRPVADSAA